MVKPPINASLCIWAVICLMHAQPAHSRPKSKDSSSSKSVTHYDQKQSGDYNIQLHLKDFQIIAVVSDDSFGGLGDYEYNYDYADFTIKPQGQGNASEVASTNPPTTSYPNHPYVIVSPSPQAPAEHASGSSEASPQTTSKTSEQPAGGGQIPVIVVTNQDLSDDGPIDGSRRETTTGIPEKFAGILASSATTGNLSQASTSPPQKATKVENVKVLAEEQDQQTEPLITNISIVPSEDGYPTDPVTLGEILHYRKCASGYSRDKRGRCRKVRRPSQPLPFGITRFATNLAAKFRQATGEFGDQSTN